MATTNGGQTWNPVFQAPLPELFPAGPFQFTSDTTGIGAGDAGILGTSMQAKS